jgi:Uma2 family endonuclease
MVSSNVKYDYLDEQDYLAGEKLAETRHDYIDGQVYAMAGTSKRHNRIALNLVIALANQSQGTPCEIYSSDIKVRIAQRKSYYYPDVVVGCNEGDDADDYYLEKPCLVIEVLSPSTEEKDNTEKLIAYQDIDSLKAYLMVDQDICRVRLVYRQDNGHWWVKTYTHLDDEISLTCPKMTLRVTDIYGNVALSNTAHP